MEVNVEERKVMRLKATIPTTDYDRPKTIGECGIFQQLG
jgi:hypothetical protein